MHACCAMVMKQRGWQGALGNGAVLLAVGGPASVHACSASFHAALRGIRALKHAAQQTAFVCAAAAAKRSYDVDDKDFFWEACGSHQFPKVRGHSLVLWGQTQRA